MTNINALPEGNPTPASRVTPVFAQRQFDFLNSASGRTPKPFLKWAGGKSRLLPVIRRSFRCLPHRFHNYIEPFLGGGAVFFDTGPQKAILGDSNPELIHCYKVVRDEPEHLLRQVLKFR